VYTATRLAGLDTAVGYARANAALPVALVHDRLIGSPKDGESPASIAPGEGRVMRIAGSPAAVSRDREGHLRAVTATCPHLGCLVRWNDAEKTWDCPCHGSRFSPDGRVLNGPAVAPLAPVGTRLA
jgi:Rieske Fe-S protein